jgi:alkylation response protein AidB-like acyl-CoA dehydrogenase
LFTEEEWAFREEVEQFLRDEAPVDDPLQYYFGRGGTTRKLYQALGDRGWLSLCWPVEHGGRALPITYEYHLWDALAYHRAARPDIGPGIVAHVITAHGTREQRDRYLPDLRAGRTCFALGYSEPEAGSDLTGLRTRAVRDGDSYVVKGEKCWTSDAHNADYLWLLCRTGAADSRSRGLTLLVVDMHAPGVSVVPIPTIDGHRLNQVFLDDVLVPASERVGEEGSAWTLIREALAVERHLHNLPGRLRRDLEDAWALVDRAGPGDHSTVQLAGLSARLAAVEAASVATVDAMQRGRSGVVEAARAKLLATTLAQDIPRVTVDLAGPAALDRREPVAFLWTQSIMETIAGGSTEVMLSILARESLGLGSGR